MKTVVLSEFVFPTKDKHIFGHGIRIGEALQYYGGDTGILIVWTPKWHRVLSTEKVKVDTVTGQCFNPFMKNPYYNEK